MTGNIQETVLKAIVKYRNHPSRLTIGEVCKKNPQFFVRGVDKDEILKEILNLGASKACASKIINKNADIFTCILHSSFNNSIYQSEFSSVLKWANISLLSLKRVTEIIRKTIDQSAYFQTSQKSLKDACFVKFPVLSIPLHQNNNMGFEKVTAHSTDCW